MLHVRVWTFCVADVGYCQRVQQRGVEQAVFATLCPSHQKGGSKGGAQPRPNVICCGACSLSKR